MPETCQAGVRAGGNRGGSATYDLEDRREATTLSAGSADTRRWPSSKNVLEAALEGADEADRIDTIKGRQPNDNATKLRSPTYSQHVVGCAFHVRPFVEDEKEDDIVSARMQAGIFPRLTRSASD